MGRRKRSKVLLLSTYVLVLVPSLPISLQAERAERRRAAYYVAATVQRVQHADSGQAKNGELREVTEAPRLLALTKRSTVNLRTYTFCAVSELLRVQYYVVFVAMVHACMLPCVRSIRSFC